MGGEETKTMVSLGREPPERIGPQIRPQQAVATASHKSDFHTERPGPDRDLVADERWGEGGLNPQNEGVPTLKRTPGCPCIEQWPRSDSCTRL